MTTTTGMTEDDLLVGLMDGMMLAGWSAWHIRRSDRALLMGARGWPDITGCPPNAGPILVIECKAEAGKVTESQAAWLVRCAQRGVTAAVVRPRDYDRALQLVLACDSRPDAWRWAFRP